MVLALVILGFLFATWLLFRYQEERFGDYKSSDNSISYEGEIIEIQRNRGYLFLKLRTGSKYSLKWASNDCYNPKRIWGFLKEGDFLRKPQNTDSLYVIRGAQKFYFILGEDIKCN